MVKKHKDEEKEKSEGEVVGKVRGYFTHVSVAAISLTDTLKIGDKIRIKGATTDFEQVVKSMQINREDVKEADAGDEIGVKVKDRVRPNDTVYKL